MRKLSKLSSSAFVSLLIIGTIMLVPVAYAQEVTGSGDASTTQGSGQGTGQGTDQGVSQGTGQGGPDPAASGLVPDENGNYSAEQLEGSSVQGGTQGLYQGSGNGVAVEANNANTGADSTNTSSADVDQSSTTSVNNQSATTNIGNGAATTGQNAASENTGPGNVGTGNAGVGVQQVTADNLYTGGSSGEISHNVTAGSHSGDYVITFDPQSGEFVVDSFRSTNAVTGAGSDNTASVTSNRETLVEVQNDGTINNTVNAGAISGQNDATQNTGNASITTGNANVAATLLNFLNANVVDGTLWLEVADIFGDLNGNVVIPSEVIGYLERRQRELMIAAANNETGAGSTNSLDIDVTNTDTTRIENNAHVRNDVIVDAITGQNTATQNTGGSTVATGDVDVTANTVTLANMNVVDGNLGLIIVNALNRWLGFLLGSDGRWTEIGHDYSTIVDAANNQAGAGSTNTADVDVTNTDTTTITNDASVTNTLNLAAITGQNTANQNTGNATVRTGDARVNATVVNVVNTNVIRGGFFVTVINVFGNWLGNLVWGGQSLAAGGGGGSLGIQAQNENTGADSTNTIDVDVTNTSTVTVDNDADIQNNLVVNADTGHNEASRNTGLGFIDTGDAFAFLHARNIANLTVAGIGGAWSELTAELVNATTGADSTNTIDVTVNDTRQVTVLNEANVDTGIGAVANTGFNTASRNTLGGQILTGVARVDAIIENLLNQTWLVGQEYGDTPYGIGIRFALNNQHTGAGSTNTSTITPNVSTLADLTNNANVNNTVDALATSGNNQADENTGTLGASSNGSGSTGDNNSTGSGSSHATAGGGNTGSTRGSSSAVGGPSTSSGSSGSTEESSESASQPAVKSAKKSRLAGRLAPAAWTSRVLGTSGRVAGAYRVLGVQEAQAAEEEMPAASPIPAPPAPSVSLMTSGAERSLLRSWPWLALAAALAIGVGTTNRSRMLLQRIFGRG